VDLFCKHWGNGLAWENKGADGPHEASFLKLDCSRLKTVFGWEPQWGIETAIDKTVEWTRVYLQNGDVCGIMDKQICEYCSDRGTLDV
jgi:CDP-glucose 4,6-dehydratase